MKGLRPFLCRRRCLPLRRLPSHPMIDSHCHLADEVFEADLPDVITRTKEAGFERVLVILEAGNAKEEAQAKKVHGLWNDVRVSIGVHPHHAHQFNGNAF